VTFPLRFTVGLHTYSEGTADGYNESAAVYTPVKTVAGTSYRVYGWSTPTSTEPKLAGHDRVIVDVELLVPPGFPAGPHDLIDLPDGQYEVLGQPEDYNNGPFGFTPGLVVNLRRTTG